MPRPDLARADQRVALITGGAGAIGLCIGKRLSYLGIQVIVADLPGRAEVALEDPSGHSARLVPLSIDVTDEASVRKAFEEIDLRFSRLDMLINCAGVSPRVNGKRPLVAETSLELWQRVLAINLTGTFLVCRAAVARMKSRKWGRIVNVASMAARTVGRATSCYYAASKSGMLGFSRVLATEVGQDGITVNCVAPARVNSPLARTLADSASRSE